MAKRDEPGRTDGKGLEPGARGPKTPPPPRRSQLSLLQIMISLIYFAVLFWAGRMYLSSEQAVYQVIMGIILGAGICILGLRTVWKRPRLAFLGWVIFLIGYMVMSGSTISIRVGSLLQDEGWFTVETLRMLVVRGILGLPALLILISAIAYLSYRQRSNNQDALLGILTLAADRGMPLAPGVIAFASQTSGVFQLWVETLGELLRRGVTLSEGLESMPGLMSRPSRLLIRIGADSGELADGLREAMASRTIQLPVFRTLGTQIAYLFWVMCTAIGIGGFMMYFILPRFEAIFKDFGVGLPEVTLFLIKTTHLTIDYAWIPGLILFGVGVAIASSLINGGGMCIPIVDRLFARRHSLLILRSILLPIAARRSIAPCLQGLARWYPTNWVRKKLQLVATDVDHGHDWIDSLHATGLIKASDAGVLASAQRAGNLVWAIRELVQTSERRWSYRLLAVMQLVSVGSLILLGGVILLLAVAYFAPLTTLILRLSQ